MKAADLDRIQAQRLETHGNRKKICVCVGAGCISSGGLNVLEAFKKEAAAGAPLDVVPVGCMGACNQGPLVRLKPAESIYQKILPEDAGEVSRGLLDDKVIPEKLLFADHEQHPAVRSDESAFYRKQLKIVLENCGNISPESLEDYIAAGGYRALYKALSAMKPIDVVEEIKKSRLRGRGGAGYPTGLKWSMVHDNKSDSKYVICNGDEGDPGAFMDRSVLEGDPHRVLEGMMIAGYAVGAQKGFVYVRAEYPLAIKRLQMAIQSARRQGLLGKNIFETDFVFDVEIRVGGGAFVCGEETALIASIEGRRGTPQPRPPYPAQSGLWGRPTLINNVETFASVAPIIQKGGGWYAGIGTPRSSGTKVFALAGRVVNTGLVEVPIGLTLREIIYEIGGGIQGGRRFKAVQTGGPSGGCIPEQFLDVPVDYESLVSLGSIMGSGGMIVMDETSCMVDVARFFMEFCMDESCGKCIPCRAGTKQMYDLLSRICSGEVSLEDLALLEELAPYVKDTSLCGLGMTAPNPLLSTLRYFREEYMAHIMEKRCPAGVCGMKKQAAGVV